MNWKQVYLERPGQKRSGPHPIDHVLAWYEAGQLASDVVLVDSLSEERCNLDQFVRLPPSPEDVRAPAPPPNNQLVNAWVCLLAGPPSMFCCCWVGWILPLASALLAIQGRSSATSSSERLQWNVILGLSLLILFLGFLFVLFAVMLDP